MIDTGSDMESSGCSQNMERHGGCLRELSFSSCFELFQAWRGSVKARHFVMSLRDYFHEKWTSAREHKESNQNPLSPGTADIDKADEWALAYLNVVRMQPITEAFDDDASGFVTVAEVNAFTTSRPIDWRFVPHRFFWLWLSQVPSQSLPLDSLLGSRQASRSLPLAGAFLI